MNRHAILLHKTFNDNEMGNDWVGLNVSQVFNNRNNSFRVVEMNRYKLGKNKLSNRLKILNNNIDLDTLNESLVQYKLKMKKKFITKQ